MQRLTESLEAKQNDRACEECPWRESNRKRRTPVGWYTKKNLRRLWAGIRKGNGMTCHPTDPRVDGAMNTNGKTLECAGALLLVQRELRKLNRIANGGEVDIAHVDRYLLCNRNGLHKWGILYWGVQRLQKAAALLSGTTLMKEVKEDSDIQRLD